MKNLSNYNSTIINIFFLAFPLSLILGNAIINLNVLLICLCSLFFYFKEITKFKINFFDKIILIFFSYILIVLVINLFEVFILKQVDTTSLFPVERAPNEIFPWVIIEKTFFYFRYLILYFILRFLMHQEILRIDWFFLSSALFAALVCFDVYVQFFFGKNIFGFEPVTAIHNSGVFGEELIAGGYLQKFALFLFFIPFIQNKKFFFKILIQSAFFIFFIYGIIFTGNRMPFVLFFFAFAIFVFLNIKSNKKKISILVLVSLFLSLLYSTDSNFKRNTNSFFASGLNVAHTLFVEDPYDQSLESNRASYVIPFHCFKIIWKKNYIFGGGLRSFRTFEGGCSSHPHNYYFEILTDLGLVGMSMILIFTFLLVKKTLKILILNSQNKKKVVNLNATPFFLIFLTEFFPFRTSGSFFSTNNAVVIFIVLAVLISMIAEKKKYIK